VLKARFRAELPEDAWIHPVSRAHRTRRSGCSPESRLRRARSRPARCAARTRTRPWPPSPSTRRPARWTAGRGTRAGGLARYRTEDTVLYRFPRAIEASPRFPVACRTGPSRSKLPATASACGRWYRPRRCGRDRSARTRRGAGSRREPAPDRTPVAVRASRSGCPAPKPASTRPRHVSHRGRPGRAGARMGDRHLPCAGSRAPGTRMRRAAPVSSAVFVWTCSAVRLTHESGQGERGDFKDRRPRDPE